MGKMYSVVMDKKVIHGPTGDYAAVKKFVSGLEPAVKAKCSVQVSSDAVAPSEKQEAHVAPAPVKQQKAAPVEKQAAPVERHEAPKRSGNDDAFKQFLESGGVSELWKPKDGRNVIRILPIGGVMPTDWKTPYPFIITGVHPNVGLSLNETVYCPRLTMNKACPICNFSWNLYNSKDPNDKQLSKRIRSYKRVLANIIDISDLDKGVQKFAFGKKLAEKIMSYKNDPEYSEDGVDFLDPEGGRNFVLIKRTVDGFPNYDDSRPEIKKTSLSSIYPNWKKECHNLLDEMKTKTYDEMMEILMDTKKAMLTTDPTEWNNGGGAQKQATNPSADDTDLGVPIVEESVEDVQMRLNNL